MAADASRHPHADAMFVENDARLPGNQRLGTVPFPNGTYAVLATDEDLHRAVCEAAMEAALDLMGVSR